MITVRIPAKDVQEALNKVKDIKAWMRANKVEGWRYEIPLGQDFDIDILIPSSDAKIAMMFKLVHL